VGKGPGGSDAADALGAIPEGKKGPDLERGGENPSVKTERIRSDQDPPVRGKEGKKHNDRLGVAERKTNPEWGEIDSIGKSRHWTEEGATVTGRVREERW